MEKYFFLWKCYIEFVIKMFFWRVLVDLGKNGIDYIFVDVIVKM